MFSLAILGRGLQLQKGLLISIPEVESVVGETGRGDGVRIRDDIEEPKSVKHAAIRFLDYATSCSARTRINMVPRMN